MFSPELQIQLSSIEANLKYFRSIAKEETEIGVVVKCDAYGLGLKKIVKFFATQNIETYFTATLEEAIQVRKIDKSAKIYTLNGFYFERAHKYHKHNIFPVINSVIEVKKFLESNICPSHVALQINSGMNRLGIDKKTLKENINLVQKIPINLIISHLSSADEPNSVSNIEQKREFLKCCEHFPKIRKSLAASHGALLNKDFHFDLIRVGIGAYGGIKRASLRSVLQIKSPIISTNTIKRGMGVGYNLTFKAQKTMKIATIPTGYGDGISRLLSNRGFLFYGNVKCPIVGRISMDLLTVNISDLKNEPTYLNFFSDEYDVSDMAEQTDTISHEIFVKLGSRYKRKYFL